MTIVGHRPRAGSREALWAWIAVALVPAGLILGAVAGLLWGENPGATGGAWALPSSLLSLAAPTAAVIMLAIRAARAGERSGRAAVVVSVLLLAGTCACPPIGVVSMGLGWFIPLAVMVAVLGLSEWRSRSKPLPPVG
jgi:hypothetical protein